ncbi:MAG TPA: efflux RND transporter periplasmic adaptor subunit [Steroidobacteraceae bacterium]|nr:efflux RND transporter periplasmic adaptor subunit [Steroidobacteraceae bacterium]
MSSSLRGRLIGVIVAVSVLLAALVGFNLFKARMIAKFQAQNASPPQTVTTAIARYGDWQPEVTSVGSMRAFRGVDVTTEIAGLVRTVNFKSGDDARSGAVLVELNADSDIAQLHALQAAADLSQTTYNRDKVQLEAQAISQAQLDGDAADLKNRRAQAEAQAALVAKKTLRAPFAGRLGITTLNPGQYLNPGDKVVTLQAIDPILVDFNLPQQQLARIAVGQALHVTTDAFPGQVFEGKLTAIDPHVDTATRNFQVEASVNNSSRRLLPGMFAHVAVQAGAVKRYLTLPQTAITYNPYGATVFIVQRSKDGKSLIARQVFVTVSETRGDQAAVTEGIKEGDTVVTSGQLKLKNGTPLNVDNSVVPRSDPHPTPQEE